MKTFDIRDPVTPEKHSLASVALSPLGRAIDIQGFQPCGEVGCMLATSSSCQSCFRQLKTK